MLKIFFTCSWEDSNNLLNKLKKNTPSNKGIWKNIEGTNDVNHFDYMVVLDDLHPSLLKIGQVAFLELIENSDKIIYFQRERTAILNKRVKSWFQNKVLSQLKHRYTYEDSFFYTFTTAHFLNKTYDQLKSMKYPIKDKSISCVVSNKKSGKTYKDRIRFITGYSNTFPSSIDIYGKGWKNELGDNYKGELGSYHQEKNKTTSKADGLLSYKYSICLENFPKEKGPSEKITDCLLMWCMPIYSGSISTNKYYPEDAFYLIDINDNNVFDNVNEISKRVITQKNIDALNEARNLILDKYNIWEQIYQIIDNNIKFKINYRF